MLLDGFAPLQSFCSKYFVSDYVNSIGSSLPRRIVGEQVVLHSMHGAEPWTFVYTMMTYITSDNGTDHAISKR